MASVFPHIEVAPGQGTPALERVLADLRTDHPAVTQWRKERNTLHFWVRDDAPDRKWFVKVYRPPFARNLLTPLLRSRARREYDNSREAFARGLPVVPAIAYGERRVGGFVVDQLVAFEDLGEVKSLAELLRWSKIPPERVLEARAAFAHALRRLHEGAYLHLAASPRNLMRVRKDEHRTEWLWIDHPSAVVLSKPAHARAAALADVLSAFESELLVPDEAAARAFLDVYAPGATAFCEQALALRRGGAQASTYCSRAKWRASWRGSVIKSSAAAGRRTPA